MADSMMGYPNVNFVNSRKAVAGMGGTSADVATIGNYGSVFALRARLAAANAAYYTSARLDSLTVNDMIFAVRNMDDATSIASYMTNSAA
jgi:hypothetical protein